MSDQEYEKFEITDYDIENEFNPNRPRRGLSKHQQIYGIWADDSDNEVDERASFKQKPAKNFSAPIGFVSGGVQQAGKKDKDIKKEETDDESEIPSASFKVENTSSNSEDEAPPQKAGFGSHVTNKKSASSEITGEIAGLRRTNNLANQSLMRKGVGNWELYTKGIGAKLLLQMGYQPGKGLGKDLQGISAPVEAHLRKGRGAIGAYGPEKSASIPKVKENIEIIDNEEREYESKWKKSDMAKKKTRYYYRTVDDVIEKGKRPGAFSSSSLANELTKVKVIDMTGPQQRVLSGYHALSGLKAPPGAEHFEDVVHKKCSNFALPEIQHNLDILVNMCEQDIINVDRRSRFSQDQLESLHHEENSLSATLAEEETLITNLKDILQILDKLMDPMQGLSLGQFAEMFRKLQQNHSEEYYSFHLGELAPGLVGPLITSALASWSPMASPNLYIDIFMQWKDILEKPQQRGTLEGNSMGIQPYDSLLWHTWVPVLRTCVSVWNIRDCEPVINLLEIWKPLLPQWILDNILDQLIMPRISTEVNNWNPLTDTVPIHYWIHPWIPLLSKSV
uniref:G-patch domain-containing protein n=2 Tax=Photinus pyralis TaxID=7054 RepID=A0A1Y1LAH9_PHOPY